MLCERLPAWVATTFGVALGLSLDLLRPALLEIDFLLVTVQRRRRITASARVAAATSMRAGLTGSAMKCGSAPARPAWITNCSRRTRQRQAIGRAVLGWWRDTGGPLTAMRDAVEHTGADD